MSDLETSYREKSNELQTTKDLKAALEHVLKVSTFRAQVYTHACHDQEDYEASGLGEAWEEKQKEEQKEKDKKRPEWAKESEEYWKKKKEEEEERLYGPRKTPVEAPGAKTLAGGIAAHVLLPEPIAVAHAAYEISDLFLNAPLPSEQPGNYLMRDLMVDPSYYVDPRDSKQANSDRWISPENTPSYRLEKLCKKIIFPIHTDDFEFVTSLERYLQHAAMRSMSYKEAESYKLRFCRRYWTTLKKLITRLLPALKLDEKIAVLRAELARLSQIGGPLMMHTGIRHGLTR